MINVSLTNEILKYITEIDKNKYTVASVNLPKNLSNRLRKNSKKKSSYASTKIEGNPLSEAQVDEIIESDSRRHYLRPEQEVRNYFLAMNFLEDKAKNKEYFSKELILDVQKIVEKGAPKEKIGLRGQTPPGVLFAVYDSETGNPDYIPPEYTDISVLLNELVEYVNNTDDHPLIVAAIVHYQLVTIHPFEDGNGRTARLLSGYILDINGYGFCGIGSLEEYFAYDIQEYYASIQMGLPANYYLGRNNPPQPEIWINYFLKMILLYSNKVCEISLSSGRNELENSLSYLNSKEKSLLLFLVDKFNGPFTPIEISRLIGVTNKTVINRLSNLAKNGFIVPNLVKERIRSYASNITIENTTIKNCGASHSIILDGVKDAVINNVTFSNCIVEKSIHSSTRFVNEAIHIDSCSNSKDAASAEPFDHTNCQNIRITNNTFAGVTTAVGAHKHSDNSNKKDIHNNITISGNTFSNVAETCVNGVRINNLTVSDNQANTKAKLFIRLHATTNFKVSGNNVDGVDRFAYAYVTDDLKEVSNGTLSKNIVKNIAAKEVPDKNGSAFQAYGFAGKFTLDGENYSTSNNNRYLIFTSGSDVTLKNSILKGGSGIKLSSGKLTVTDNKIWDAKKAGLIAEKGGSNTIKNNIFMFKDVTDNGKYYFTPVYWAAKKGITSGYNDGSFGPAKNCTRAHVVTFLWRLAGKPNPKTKKNPFKDIKSNQYYYKAVLWASEKGITKGYSDGTFKPDATCLREHVVTFLWRYAGKPNPKTKTNPFNDVKSKDYFYKASIWANEKGVAKGYSSGQYKGGFGPHLNCLREHVVTFLYRYAK